jgi:hypothetical protein
VLAGIHNANKQHQVARMYDVFGRWSLSSRCYLAAFIAIMTVFLMMMNISLSLTETYCEISMTSEQCRGFVGVSDYYRNWLTLK